MNTEPKYGVLSSSVNPQELSLTVEAFMKSISFIAVYLFASKGLPVDQAQALYSQIISLVVQMIPAIISVWFAGQSLFGLFRKLVVKKIS